MEKYTKETLTAAIINQGCFSVSHGTMRNEDLIPTFVSVLFILNADKMRNYWKENPDLLQAICDKNAGLENGSYWLSDAADYDIEQLFDMLNQESPEGFYFGSHPGDGSDYGFWKEEE